MTPQVVFFGERPGPNTDPLRPLFPHTTTGAAAKLINLLGVSTEHYLEHSCRYNVFNNGTEDVGLDAARRRVEHLMTWHLTQHQDPRFVFVGGEALRAAPQFYRRMLPIQINDAVLYLPHTSGVNRWYNSPENTMVARSALAGHLRGTALLQPVEDAAASSGAAGTPAAGGGQTPPYEAPAGPPEC